MCHQFAVSINFDDQQISGIIIFTDLQLHQAITFNFIDLLAGTLYTLQ